MIHTNSGFVNTEEEKMEKTSFFGLSTAFWSENA